MRMIGRLVATASAFLCLAVSVSAQDQRRYRRADPQVTAPLSVTEKKPQPPHGEDCAPYNPATLQLIDEGPRGWLIRREDGARFLMLDTREDGEVMLRVFRAHSAFCYVGRNNKRPDRATYVSHYWK
jgi:hypothetical protein